MATMKRDLVLVHGRSQQGKHVEAQQTDRELLPKSIRGVLARYDQGFIDRTKAWRAHSAAARNFHTAHKRMATAAQSVSRSDNGCSLDG
ncbi:MAG: hypothetical protein QOK02_4330 [Mycobacterium sp.]|jgi:hypothetical protein|nr:hypothetical protein [Mycobacterium sp.]